jgi:transcription elongation factor GreB
MSKAFTREETDGPEMPDLRPLASTLPPGAKNYMTPDGAERLREELTRLVEVRRPQLAAARNDPDSKRQLAGIDQRIAKVEQSLQTAEVVRPRPGETNVVRFGATVVVREESGEESTYRIVGVDETDVDRGWVSWLSPIAKTLMNARLGERVRFKFPLGEADLEIVRIAYD